MNLLDEFRVMSANVPSKMLGTRNAIGHEEMVFCSRQRGHQRGGRRIGKLSIELPQEALTKRVAWTWMSDCLVQPFVTQLLRSSCMTGFETRPIDITENGISVEHSLEELVPVGWGGVADPASGVKLLESCSSCGLLRYSGVSNWNRLIDLRQWDGSDIFIVWPLPRYIFVTEKLANLLSTNHIEEVKQTSLCNMRPQDSELSPGRVSYWLPMDRIGSIHISKDII